MLAYRDLATYRRLSAGSGSAIPHGDHAGPKPFAHIGVPHIFKSLLAMMGAMAGLVLLGR
jgi:hypothetical protein